MKKKLLAILMGVVVVAVGGATLAACSDNGGGDTGTTVTNGEDGKSAYQIWLDAGNTGTQADFIKFLTGSDGVLIDEITYKSVSGYTIYTITLTDGTVLTKYYEPSYLSSDDSDIKVSSSAACEIIAEGDPEPNLIFQVEYDYNVGSYSHTELINLSDMEIIAGEVDYTKAGNYSLFIKYKDYTGTVYVYVEDDNDESIRDISVESTPTLWFSDDTIAENLKHVYMNVRLANANSSVSYSPTEDQYVSGPTTSATFEGISDVVFKIEGRLIEVPVYVIDSTCAKYLAESNDYAVILPIKYDGPYSIMQDQDLFTGSETFTIQAELQGTECSMILPLTDDLLITTDEEEPVAFSSETAGSYTLTLNLKAAGLNEKAPINTDINVDVYAFDDDSIRLLGVTLSSSNTLYDGDVYNAIPVSDTFPELYVDLRFSTSKNYSYIYIRDVLLTEDMVTNLANIDFSLPGTVTLGIKYEGFTSSLNIELLDFEKNNISRASTSSSIPTSDVTNQYEYTIGEKSVEDIQAQIINEHTRCRLLYISYHTKVDGQSSRYVIVTPEMIDFSCTDFSKLGLQTVYVVYGEGANQVRLPLVEVSIMPDTTELSKYKHTSYTYAGKTLYLYENNIAIILGSRPLNWGTYTQDNDKIVFSNFNGDMYITLDTEALKAEATEVEGEPVKTYKQFLYEYQGSSQSLVFKVYADYVVYGTEIVSGIGTEEESTQFIPSMTLSASAITSANTVYILNDEYKLYEDGTFEQISVWQH